MLCATTYDVREVYKGAGMVKKLLTIVIASLFLVGASLPMFGQEKAKKTEKKAKKTEKKDRWEGVVQRSDKDKSTLTVRKMGSSIEKVIHYDSSTHWVSQEHGSKKVNDIDASQVKDGDRVIVLGTEGKDGFHATLISKRLTKLAP